MRGPQSSCAWLVAGIDVQKTGTEIGTVWNNLDASSEYILKLKHRTEEQCLEVISIYMLLCALLFKICNLNG